MSYWIEVDGLGKKKVADHAELVSDFEHEVIDRVGFDVGKRATIEWAKLYHGRKIIGMRKFPKPYYVLPGDYFHVTYRFTMTRVGPRVELLLSDEKDALYKEYYRKTFMEWLALEYPDIVLSDWQIHVVTFSFGKSRGIVHTPLRAGKTFLFNLINEYISEVWGGEVDGHNA